MAAPAHLDEYAGTFGALLPCIRDDTGEAIVTSVDLHYAVKPVRSVLWLRTIGTEDGPQWSTPSAVRGPTYSLLGAPPDFDQDYAHGPIGGSFAPLTFPVTFSDRCGEVAHQVDRKGDGRKNTRVMHELMVTQWAKGGSQLTSMTVHYTADGEEYVEEIEWDMVVCGSRLGAAQSCGPDV